MWLCHESIYQAVYRPGSQLMRPSPLAPQHRSPLRTGCDHRRAQQRAETLHDALRSRLVRTEVTRTVFEGVERSAALGELSANGVVRVPSRSILTIAFKSN